MKGRDVLGPVDTAESPESELSGAKIRVDEDISPRAGLKRRETKRGWFLSLFPSVSPSLGFSHALPASRLVTLCSL